jgi:hypothetical protein
MTWSKGAGSDFRPTRTSNFYGRAVCSNLMQSAGCRECLMEYEGVWVNAIKIYVRESDDQEKLLNKQRKGRLLPILGGAARDGFWLMVGDSCKLLATFVIGSKIHNSAL